MKYLKKFKYLYESASYHSETVLDLKDMSLELTDMGYTVVIFKDGPDGVSDNIRVMISKRDGFTIDSLVREFLYRSIRYMRGKGYERKTSSNFGKLIFKDNRIIASNVEASEKGPYFTMINILFRKS